MGWYRERVLPLLVDWTLDTPVFREERRRALEGARGVVLEVGFGTGLNLAHYPPGVERLYAVEPSPGMRRRAARRLATAPFPVEWVGIEEGGGYPLPDDSVDTVVTTCTLCTLPAPAAAVAEFRRVLKPGGRYLFLEHGAAESRRLRRWQARLNPLQNRLGGGCHLDRPIDGLVRRSFPGTPVARYRLPHAPRLLAQMYRGSATKEAGAGS